MSPVLAELRRGSPPPGARTILKEAPGRAPPSRPAQVSERAWLQRPRHREASDGAGRQRELEERGRTKKRWGGLRVDRPDGRKSGILKSLGGPDGNDRNPGVDGHIQERCQALGSHCRVVAITVVVSGIV